MRRNAPLLVPLAWIAALGLGPGWSAPTAPPKRAAPSAAVKKPVRVAVLTELRDAVELQRAGAKSPAMVDYTTLLSTGDLVRVESGAGAALLYADGAREPLAPGAEVRVRAVAGVPTPAFATMQRQLESVLEGGTRPTDLRGFQLRGFQLRGGGPVRSAYEEGEGRLLAAHPRWCAIAESRPTFRFPAVKGGTELRLTLYDAPDETELWTTALKAEDTEAPYPASKRPLAPGRYKWEITGRVRGRLELTAADFTIQSPATSALVTERIAAAGRVAPEGEPNLTLITAYMQFRMYPEAEAALKAARERNACDRTVNLLLARVYSQTFRDVPGDLLPEK